MGKGAKSRQCENRRLASIAYYQNSLVGTSIWLTSRLLSQPYRCSAPMRGDT